MNCVNYISIPSGEREIINRITAKYKKTSTQINNIRFPYIFLTIKFHKNPVAFRTVTCGFNTYLNIAGKKLLKYLKDGLVDLKDSFIIDNSYKVIKNIGSTDKKVFGVYTYDFKDLFNSISIQDLDNVLEKLFDMYELYRSTDVVKFKALKDIVLNENYIVFKGQIYRQVLGIAQGAPCSNFLANIYLYYYEKSYKNDTVTIFRYIDDIIVFNFHDRTEYVLNFYPDYLVLKQTSNKHNEVNFLDLNIKLKDNSDTNIGISSNHVMFDIYDKTDEFNFKVIKLQNWYSNIHLSLFRNILINQCRRIKALCNDKNLRDDHYRKLYNDGIKSDYPRDFLLKFIYH